MQRGEEEFPEPGGWVAAMVELGDMQEAFCSSDLFDTLITLNLVM